MLLTLLGLVAAAATPEPVWRRADASLRFLVAPGAGRSHLLRVDLPPDIPQPIKGACAYSVDGTAIPANVVRLQEAAVAVEVAVPRRVAAEYEQAVAQGVTTRLPLEVYLLPETETPLPCRPPERTPVALTRALQRLTTRPYTGEELVMLEAKHKAVTYGLDLAGFTGSLPFEKWNTPPERLTARLTWSTELLVPAAITARFGADQTRVAWFVFVDGGFVAGWKEGEALPAGGRLGAPLELAPGLHRLDLFVIQQEDEPLPQLIWQTPDTPPQPPPADQLTSAHATPAVRIERKDALLMPGLRTTVPTRYLLPAIGGSVCCFSVYDLSAQQSGRKIIRSQLRVGDRPPIEAFGPRLVTAGLTLPAMELSVADELGYEDTLKVPVRSGWFPLEVADPRLELLTTPACLVTGDRLALPFRLTGLPGELATALGESAVVSWVLLDREGGPLATGTVPAPVAGASALIEVDSRDDMQAVELSCWAPGAGLLTPRLSVQVLRPADSFSGLEARGERLYRNGVPVVLLARPLGPWVGDRGHPGSRAPETEPVAGLRIVDDFWAVAAGPEATILPEEWLARSGGITASRIQITASRCIGVVPELRKFTALEQVFAAPADWVLWAIGAEDARAGVPASAVCKQLLFLAQATKAHGATPLLLALPALPGGSWERARETALLIKELALTLQVPVVDAYSRSVLERDTIGEFQAGFRCADGRMGLSTPNNRGRTWLCRLVEETLVSVASVPARTNGTAVPTAASESNGTLPRGLGDAGMGIGPSALPAAAGGRASGTGGGKDP
jgi:hypothetical protein